MITLSYSRKRSVDVNKGMAKSWQREFQMNDVRVPQGWKHAMEINGRMVTFSFCYITGAKIPKGSYIIVHAKGTRDELFKDIGSYSEKGTYYLMDVMTALKPQKEDDMKPLGDVWKWLEENSVAKFTQQDYEQWQKEKKMEVR